MTTLEWLLIVGAVAGLAALAVVLVGRLVDDTAESVAEGGATANRNAAETAAAQIEEQARAADNVGRYTTWSDWRRYYSGRCSRLEVLYSTIGLKVDSYFYAPYGQTGAPTEEALADARPEKPENTGDPAQIRCEIND
ncbi:MAG: hypothetical protein OXG47_08650 [bacterium]|nr:hypothetical protein [bacterium]MCY3926403.1 hypothetical protein [bacterium]